jgi:hypothetical protein
LFGTATKRSPEALYFDDLKLTDTFRIVGRDAIYQKIRIKGEKTNFGYEADDDEKQLELQTGIAFPPTKSPVELIPVEMSIGVPKPAIYAG